MQTVVAVTPLHFYLTPAAAAAAVTMAMAGDSLAAQNHTRPHPLSRGSTGCNIINLRPCNFLRAVDAVDSNVNNNGNNDYIYTVRSVSLQ